MERKIIEAIEKVKLICDSAFDKKAEDIVIMDMRQKAAFCDHFVVMNAPSSARVKTIADHIEESLETQGHRASHKEGYLEALWVLLDYGDVVVHVFHHETRKFYNLENLWGDAPKRIFLK